MGGGLMVSIDQSDQGAPSTTVPGRVGQAPRFDLFV